MSEVSNFNECVQNLIERIKDFLRSANKRELSILRQYIDRYFGFSFFVSVAFLGAMIGFSCGPLLLSMKLPAMAWYPFSIDPPFTRLVLYVHHVAAIFQTGFGMTVDFTVAMFFWFSAARFEMLKIELENVSNEMEIKLCIKRHQEIIGFIEETQEAVKYIIAKLNITMACVMSFGAIPLLYDQSFAVILPFSCTVLAACERLLVTAWPADDLCEASQTVAFGAYDSRWMRKGTDIHQSVCFLIQRSQRPLIIRMGGVLPNLSLRYYSNFLTTIASYFMAMRTAISNQQKDA